MSYQPTTHKNRQYKGNKIFIVGASLATLMASGDVKISEHYFKSGNVNGSVSKNDDIISIGVGDGLVASGAGDDDIIGGASVDTILGGTGADIVQGGASLDNFVVIGLTLNAGYKTSDFQDVAGVGVDLSEILNLASINNHSVSDLAVGDSLDGGADGALLFTFGKVDFTGVTLANIYQIYLDDELVISDSLLQDLIGTGLTGLLGNGVIKASSGLLDLDGLTVPPEITIMDSVGNIIVPAVANSSTVNVLENNTGVGTFNVTDESAVGNVIYTLSGADSALFDLNEATGELNFLTPPDFENAQDDGTNNVYNVTVAAIDEHLKTSLQDVIISVVNDQNEPNLNLYVGNEFVRIGNGFFVESPEYGSMRSPQIVGLKDGGYAVIWQKTGNVELQIFNFVGSARTENINLGKDVENIQNWVDVDLLENGNFAVTWREQEYGVKYVGYVQIFNSDGISMGNKIALSAETQEYQSAASIASLSDGGFATVWELDNSIQLSIFDDAGTVTLNEKTLSDRQLITESDNNLTPDIAVLNSGNIVVCWTRFIEDEFGNFDVDIRAMIVDPDGNIVNAEFQVNGIASKSPRYYADDAKVVGLSNGGFVITWGNGDDNRVKAQVFDDNGATIGSEIDLGRGDFPSILAQPEGGFIISHSVILGTLYIEPGEAIVTQKFTNDGQKIGNSFRVNSDTYESHENPAVEELAGGGFTVAWDIDGYFTDDEGFSTRIHIVKVQPYELAPIYKLSTNQTSDFKIVANADFVDASGVLNNVIITNIPTDISFNNGVLVADTLTLTSDDLENLLITTSNGLNGRMTLDIEAIFDIEGVIHKTNTQLKLSVGNDSLVATPQNDHIEGVNGMDVLQFNGDVADYSFAIVGNDIEITEVASNADNVDLIHNIEWLQFNNGPMIDVSSLDDSGYIVELSGAEYDSWLLLSYDLGV